MKTITYKLSFILFFLFSGSWIFSQKITISGTTTTDGGRYNPLNFFLSSTLMKTKSAIVLKLESLEVSPTPETTYYGKPLSYFRLSQWPDPKNLNFHISSVYTIELDGKELEASVNISEMGLAGWPRPSHVELLSQVPGADLSSAKFIKTGETIINHFEVPELQRIIEQKEKLQ